MTEETEEKVSPFPRVAVLGGGVMGGTIVTALRVTGWPSDRIVVAESDSTRAAALNEVHGIQVEAKIAKATKDADAVVIAVKPQDVEDVLKDVTKALGTDAFVVTVAAALPFDFYEKRLPAGTPVIRAMPNTPAIVGQGVIAIAPGTHATEEQMAIVESMLLATGLVVRVEESSLDAVTAVSGSGPAYFYAMVEALTEAGVAQGLDRTLATQLAAQTFVGAAKLLTDSNETPQGLRKRVTSPSGTTAAALQAMGHAGLQDVISAGVKAAVARAKEMVSELTKG